VPVEDWNEDSEAESLPEYKPCDQDAVNTRLQNLP
jgi:hypothetical protein